MELKTNASTDDLLCLEIGNPTPEQVHTNLNVNASASESTEQISQTTTPHTTPSIRRKSRNTLRLNLDENTWTKQDGQKQPAATTKFRQNLQAGVINFLVNFSSYFRYKFNFLKFLHINDFNIFFILIFY